jgi:tetratricopeptide (TPR) repeat protein
MYQQGLDLQPSSLPFRIGLANSLFKRMKYRDAIPLYRGAEAGPFVETSVYQQGLCYYYLGSYDTARVLLERAIALDTTNVGAHYNLGLTLMNTADYPGAVRCFENAIRHSRSDIITSSYDRIGVAHYELGKRDAALKAFRKSIDENPKNPRAHYDLGVLYENLMNDRPKAIECYRKVVSIEEPSSEEGSLYYKARERLTLLGAR